MSGDKRQARNQRLGIASCFLFAFVSLGFAIFETRTLLHLLNDGERAEGVVVEIDVGVKGGKKAVVRFVRESGEQVTSRDFLHMYLIRHAPGDTVTVLYDPADTEMVTVDVGPWIWQEPALLFAGFGCLFGLGILCSLQIRHEKPGRSVPDAKR